jgi:hypothetical protein
MSAAFGFILNVLDICHHVNTLPRDDKEALLLWVIANGLVVPNHKDATGTIRRQRHMRLTEMDAR